VEAGIRAGQLAPGDHLPPVRELAGRLGVSPATVAAAYGDLRRRGLTAGAGRAGTRVRGAPPVSSRVYLSAPAGTRDLITGGPDPELLPLLPAWPARRPARMYAEAPVSPRLRRLAAGQLAADGIDTASLAVTGGALDAIERVLEAHLRPGDRVAVENPGYAALFDLLRARGLSLEPVRVDERGMLPGELQAVLQHGARAAIITPRGQNPTGAALDAGRARELRAVIAKSPQTLVIEDDHLGAVAGSELHSTVAGLDRWAATRSVAKALGPDLRLAVLAGDAHTIARVQRRQQCGPGWVSHILQRLVLNLWKDPATQALVRRASATYVERREAFLESLHGRGVQASGASGLNVWIRVHDEAGVVGALLQRGWVVAPGTAYRLAGSPPAIRVTISTLGVSQAERLAGDLADVFAPARSSRSG
jgi:DNA-binding transcriptional MocR family regulator